MTCHLCHGEGLVPIESVVWRDCRFCGGRGCGGCDHTGRIPQRGWTIDACPACAAAAEALWRACHAIDEVAA